MRKRRTKRAANLARLEAKIDRLLVLMEKLDRLPTMPVYPSPYYPYGMPPVITCAATGTIDMSGSSRLVTEFVLDETAITAAIEPHIIAAARKASKP